MDAKKDGYKNDIIELGVDEWQISLFGIQELYSLNKKIPKEIKNLEEGFLGSLELVHTSESRKDFWTFLPQIFSFDASFLIPSGDKSGDISLNSDSIINSIIMNTEMSVLSVGSSHDRQTVRGDQKFASPDSSCSSSTAYNQGTLECSWNDGVPSYVFTEEGKRRVFITTNVLKDSISDPGVDYIYVFRSGDQDSGFHFLGEMSVSTSFELCPHGTEFAETRFVLYAKGDNLDRDDGNPDQKTGKNKGLAKKMANALRRRSFMRSFGKQESLLEQNQDGDRLPPPKLELAAIVTKDRVRGDRKEGDLGGWGLKFLRKDRNCESCGRCSTGTNVLIPAGFHGGPRSRTGGGPSSLVERWRSGGSCDCGGWDLGCPLTVLQARPNHEDSASFDLFVEGCKQREPVLKMTNVRGGLYGLYYKSTLSLLQSLSIAVAAIHGRSRIIRPE